MSFQDDLRKAREAAYWRSPEPELEARWMAVPCPTCKVPAGEPCVYRGKVRGPGDERRIHLSRPGRAITAERREAARMTAAEQTG